MAGSMYAYVRTFELPDPVLPNTFMVVRIDGKGFHKFADAHQFVKPNDGRALELMNEAARHVVRSLRPDVVIAFGESDEYSFLFRQSCSLYNRRASKIVTHVVSLFTSAYVFHWARYMDGSPLQYPPSFDGRLVVYPTEKEVRDYFAWRQADTHINNLYNTTFWALVQDGAQTEREAHETLRGTVSAEKNEILFARFHINYDKLPAMFRKGTTLVWDAPHTPSDAEQPKRKPKVDLRTVHVDIIGKAFWLEPNQRQTIHADADADDSALPVWERAERTRNTAGLGRNALQL